MVERAESREAEVSILIIIVINIEKNNKKNESVTHLSFI